MNHKPIDEIRKIFTPTVRSTFRPPIDKSIDQGPQGGVNMKQ